jgi:methionine aminopeptidase
MRTGMQLMALLLPMTCLGACGEAARPELSTAHADATVAATAMETPVDARTSAADDGLAIAVARETVDRAAREQTLRVQQQLRDQERLREAAVRALNSGNERCIAGQKVRRVGNGWVQAGTC